MQHTKDTVFISTAATNVTLNPILYGQVPRSPIQVLTTISVA